MAEMLRIRKAEEYFEEYGRNGIGKGADRWMIKRQLIDAFHKEIFGLVAMRAKKTFQNGIPPVGHPEAIRIAKSIVHDVQKKGEKLCRMFAQYRETSNLLEIDDLKMDENEILSGIIMENTKEEQKEA